MGGRRPLATRCREGACGDSSPPPPSKARHTELLLRAGWVCSHVPPPRGGPLCPLLSFQQPPPIHLGGEEEREQLAGDNGGGIWRGIQTPWLGSSLETILQGTAPPPPAWVLPCPQASSLSPSLPVGLPTLPKRPRRAHQDFSGQCGSHMHGQPLTSAALQRAFLGSPLGQKASSE